MLGLGGLASSMFASHFVAQTTLLGDALLPQSPWKTRSKRGRFEPKKRLEMCPFRSLFLARSSRFFRRWRRKKMALYALSFFSC